MIDAEKDYQDTAKELISDFNEAKFQIWRLHNEWTECNRLSQKGKLLEWKWRLDVIWRELSTDAYERDGGSQDKGTYYFENKEINEKISNAKNRDEFYNALQEKDVFLRRLQTKVGKGSKKSPNDDTDLDF